jgi:hypothetical protein
MRYDRDIRVDEFRPDGYVQECIKTRIEKVFHECDVIQEIMHLFDESCGVECKGVLVCPVVNKSRLSEVGILLELEKVEQYVVDESALVRISAILDFVHRRMIDIFREINVIVCQSEVVHCNELEENDSVVCKIQLFLEPESGN